jgi:hypothetical protein
LSGKCFDNAPESVVTKGEFEYGRFGTLFGRANLLDVERPFLYRIPRLVKYWRLKEWQAFQFGDQRWFFFTSLYNAKTLSMALFYAYDRERKRRYGFQRPIPGSAFSFGESLSGAAVAYRGPLRFLEYDCEFGSGRIQISAQRYDRDSGRSFAGEFRFSCGPKVAAPEAVCLPLGMNRAMYSTKLLMPFEGEFTVGNEVFRFGAPGAMGIMDDHKGYYPYRLHYDWVTGFGLDQKGRRAGFNLTDNQVRDQAKYNENCLWVNNKIWPLPPVKVTRPQGIGGEWIIQDTEGLVDLVFVPEVPNDVRFNLGFIESDYHGPLGSFRGVVKNGEGEKVQAELLYGAGEQKYLRA